MADKCDHKTTAVLTSYKGIKVTQCVLCGKAHVKAEWVDPKVLIDVISTMGGKNV